jgi:subtilisin family serine protease
MDAIFRGAAILMMIGVIAGAVQAIVWLGSAWFTSVDVVPLSVQAFDVAHGDKVGKDEGKYLATRFVKQLKTIQDVMSADLTTLDNTGQVRFESVVPKSLNLRPDVSVKIDVEVKAFDVDVVGIVQTVYKFFDPSDRLQVSVWSNENIKLFAAFKTRDERRSIGPWWVEKQNNEQAAVETLAHLFALDLYKTRVSGLDGLDAQSFATFVSALGDYQQYVKARHADPTNDKPELLKPIGDRLQKLADDAKASALVYSYLGSVRSLQNRGDAAFAAYEQAVHLNPNDEFAVHARDRLLAAKALQPVAVAAAAAAAPDFTLGKLEAQKLPGYEHAALLPALRDIIIAVIGTGISPELSKLLGVRLVSSSSVVPNDDSPDDHSGHGTSVIALAAGLAPSARFISVKSISASGTGDVSVIADGIRNAVAARANVICLPLASSAESAHIKEAVQAAMTAGVLIIAGSGNEGLDQPAFPARQPGVLAIGAIDLSEKLAPFSNGGPGVFYAPGVDVLTLGESGLTKRSGTSFATAIASAITAVVWAAKPGYSADQIRDLLRDTSVDLGEDSKKPQFGHIRRIDLAAALQ